MWQARDRHVTGHVTNLYFQVRFKLHEALEDGHISGHSRTMESCLTSSFGVYLQRKHLNVDKETKQKSYAKIHKKNKAGRSVTCQPLMDAWWETAAACQHLHALLQQPPQPGSQAERGASSGGPCLLVQCLLAPLSELETERERQRETETGRE